MKHKGVSGFARKLPFFTYLFKCHKKLAELHKAGLIYSHLDNTMSDLAELPIVTLPHFPMFGIGTKRRCPQAEDLVTRPGSEPCSLT